MYNVNSVAISIEMLTISIIDTLKTQNEIYDMLKQIQRQWKKKAVKKRSTEISNS